MQENSLILVVDDEQLIRRSICARLQADGMDCRQAADLAEARSEVVKRDIELVLLDVRLPDGDGLSLLEEIADSRPQLPVIMMTAYSTVESAVGAMKLGAADYVAKPFDLEHLSATVHRVLRNARQQGEQRTTDEQHDHKFGLNSLIGGSAAMREARSLARRVAQSNANTVLILGETGTGKDLLAHAMHYESPRVERPFVNITCTAMPDALLDSELFGYEKGAFTDAKERKRGLFELAHGGTAFLDEVGDMSPSLQAKLLRVLEERRFRNVGGTEDVEVDVRVFAATHRDLGAAAQEGRFRPDLFYRLNAMPIVMPPLRERVEDVPALARHFAAAASSEDDGPTKTLTAAAEQRLMDYPWPGNVRELRNVVERAVLLSSTDVVEADELVLGRKDAFPTPTQGASNFNLPPEGVDLNKVDRDLTLQALERTAWNQTQAAKLLGVTRDQVRYRIEKHDLKQGE